MEKKTSLRFFLLLLLYYANINRVLKAREKKFEEKLITKKIEVKSFHTQKKKRNLLFLGVLAIEKKEDERVKRSRID